MKIAAIVALVVIVGFVECKILPIKTDLLKLRQTLAVRQGSHGSGDAVAPIDLSRPIGYMEFLEYIGKCITSVNMLYETELEMDPGVTTISCPQIVSNLTSEVIDALASIDPMTMEQYARPHFALFQCINMVIEVELMTLWSETEDVKDFSSIVASMEQGCLDVFISYQEMEKEGEEDAEEIEDNASATFLKRKMRQFILLARR